MTSTPLLNACSCGPIPTPPKTAAPGDRRVDRERGEIFDNLRRKLPRRRQHERARRAPRFIDQTVENREQKRRRLSAAGLRGRNDVLAQHRRRDRFGLNRRGPYEAELLEALEERRVKPEIVEWHGALWHHRQEVGGRQKSLPIPVAVLQDALLCPRASCLHAPRNSPCAPPPPRGDMMHRWLWPFPEEAMRRREFLTTVVAASVLPQVTGRAAAAPAAAAPEQLKLGVASYSLRKFPFDKALEMAKACDVKYINFKDVHLAADRPARSHQGRAREDRSRGLHDHGRRHHHVAEERRSTGPKGLRVRQARGDATHRRRAELRCARHGREGREGIRHQGRHPQSRSGGQVLPVAVRRVQARQGTRQAHGPVRRHRPYVAGRSRSDQGHPRAARPRVRSPRQGSCAISRTGTAR